MSKKYPPQSGAPDQSLQDLFGRRQLHRPVLLEQVLAVLDPQRGESYLDLTAGYGGHAARVMEKTGESAPVTLVDRDESAIAYLKKQAWTGVRLMHQDFVSAAQTLIEDGQAFDMVLLDLGISSPQLDGAERGFSFRYDSPLDMRMDQRQSLSAKGLINTLSAQELSRIIRDFGEERPAQAKRIAHAIVDNRPIETGSALARVIARASIRKGRTKIHPATRTFQAIRLQVNDELGQLSQTLPLLPQLLKDGGRVVAISFHSLEDRMVKRYLKEQSEAGLEANLRLLTKKPVTGAIEDVHNPRARSAKLRAAVKINKSRLDLK